MVKIWEKLFSSEQEERMSRASSHKKIIDDVCIGQYEGLNVFFSVREQNDNCFVFELECGGIVYSFSVARNLVSLAGAGVLSRDGFDVFCVLDESLIKKIDKILDECGLVDRKNRYELSDFFTNEEKMKNIEEYTIYDEELTKHVIVGKCLVEEHKISGGEAIEKYVSIYELVNNRFVFVFYVPYSQSTIIKSASKTDLAKNRGAFYFEHFNHNYQNIHFARINALLASLGICDDSTWKKEVIWK